MSEDNRFDGILMSIIQQKGNIDGFFDSVFGFLRRNTDFFANQKKAEEIIVGTCKKNFDKYTADQVQKQKEQAKKKQAEEKKRKLKEQQAKKQATKTVQQVKVEPVKVPVPDKKAGQQEKKQEEDKTPAPLGNGGRTSKYIWTQTLEALEMYVFLDKDVTKSQVKVIINVDSLKVLVKGEPIIDGKLKEKVNAEDSLWIIDDGQIQDYKGKYINISIQKWKNQTSWWNSVIQGDQEINTQKINPEPSKLSDLDGQTRSTVQKMMFDMKQKQAGLPSSDELQKQDKMKEFMKAHPEMDFSQCKFN